MSTTAPIVSEPAADPAAPSRPVRRAERLWARPFAQHAVAVAVLLLALMPLLGTSRLFHVDEGATLAQAELLADGDGWKYQQPRVDLDPADRWSPLWPADGDGSAPLAKHPTYASVVSWPMKALGVTGAVLVSLAGAWAAAVIAALIARRLGPGIDKPVLWITAMVSPMFLYGYVTVAHTVSAAAAGGAVLAALRGFEGRTLRAPFWVGGLALLATLLRSEGAMLGVALGLALLLVAAREHRLDLGVTGLAALGATLAGYVLIDPWLTSQIVSDSGPFVIDETSNPTSGYLIDRVVPTSITLLLPGYLGFGGLGGLLSVIVALTAAMAAWIVRRRPEDVAGIKLFVVVAAGAAVVRLALAPAVVPGLLVALPLIVPGLILLRRSALREPAMTVLVVSYALFVGAVLATQYRLGGTGEWGFRYAIVGLPALVPVVVAGLASARTAIDARTRQVVTTCLVVVCVATSVLAAGSLRRPQAGSDRLIADIEAVRAEADRPVVVTNDNTVPRFAWEQILAGDSWLRVPVAEMVDVVPVLAADGGDVVLVSTEVDEQLPLFADTHRVVSRSQADLAAGREIVLLEPI